MSRKALIGIFSGSFRGLEVDFRTMGGSLLVKMGLLPTDRDVSARPNAPLRHRQQGIGPGFADPLDDPVHRLGRDFSIERVGGHPRPLRGSFGREAVSSLKSALLEK